MYFIHEINNCVVTFFFFLQLILFQWVNQPTYIIWLTLNYETASMQCDDKPQHSAKTTITVAKITVKTGCATSLPPDQFDVVFDCNVLGNDFSYSRRRQRQKRCATAGDDGNEVFAALDTCRSELRNRNVQEPEKIILYTV